MNRTAETPLAVEVWADIVLPLVVDEVVNWSEVPAGAEVEMMVEGVVLDSPTDMAACWPAVWSTPGAARLWRQNEFTRAGNPIRDSIYRDCCPCEFRYQRPGARQKWRAGAFDPTVVPDPRAWLEARLGPLAGFALAG